MITGPTIQADNPRGQRSTFLGVRQRPAPRADDLLRPVHRLPINVLDELSIGELRTPSPNDLPRPGQVKGWAPSELVQRSAPRLDWPYLTTKSLRTQGRSVCQQECRRVLAWGCRSTVRPMGCGRRGHQSTTACRRVRSSRRHS